MTSIKPCIRGCIRLLCAAAFVFGSILNFSPVARAATGRTSAIRGTVSNAATGNNLNNASVQLKGVQQEVLTERDGSYIFIGLAPGTYEMTVSYTGLDPEKRMVSVGAGETARQDFTLTSGPT